MRKAIGAVFIVSLILASCATMGTKQGDYAALQAGNLAFGRGDYKEASKKYEQYLRGSTDSGIVKKLSESLRQEKNYSRIAEVTEKYASGKTMDQVLAFDYANALYMLGAREKALGVYAKVTGLKDITDETMFKYAQDNQEQSNFDLSLRAYLACIALNGTDFMAHNNRAYILYYQNVDLDEAIREIEYPIKALPDDPWCRRMTGHLWLRKGDFEKALSYYQAALALYSDKSEYGVNGVRTGKMELLVGIGRSYAKLGKADNARKAYLEAVELGSLEAATEMATLK